MHEITYSKLNKNVCTANIDVRETVMRASVESERDVYADLNTNLYNGDVGANDKDDVDDNTDEQNITDDATDGENEDDANDIENAASSKKSPLDVTVFVDGTLHKRDFISSHGVGIVIAVLTGLVLDYEVMTKSCHACATAKAKNMTEDERKK